MTDKREPVEYERRSWHEYEIVIIQNFYSGTDLDYFQYQIVLGEMVISQPDKEFNGPGEAREIAIGEAANHRRSNRRLPSIDKGVGSLLKEIAAERAAARANQQPVQIMRREPVQPKKKGGKTTNRRMLDL